MSRRPTLNDFLDDELMRAPMMLDEVLDAVQQAWRRPAPGQAGVSDSMLREFLRVRGDIVSQAMRSMRRQVAAELGAQGTDTAEAAPTVQGGESMLALLDDEAVAADLELTRAVQMIRSITEFELLELQAYTSALVGDLQVSRDTNPLRPATWAKGLVDGASGAGLGRIAQATLLRAAADPLAQLLRKAYAAACTRLEGQGVEPGAYRTIVLHLGHTDAPVDDSAVSDLTELRDSMPVPLDMPRSQPGGFEQALDQLDRGVRSLPDEVASLARAQALQAARRNLIDNAASAVDQQLVEMLSRLFDELLADRRLPRGALALLSRLQPSLLRLALRDEALLRDWSHPAWQFMERLVFLLDRLGGPRSARTLQHLQAVLEHLLREGTPDADRFRWGLERLAAFERHAVEQARGQAADRIARLQATEPRPPPAEADGNGFAPSQPLDIGSLDTLPADLMEPAPSGRAASIDALDVGDWLRVHLQGEWRTLLLLWRSDSLGTWLLMDPPSRRQWALRRRALDQLGAAGVAAPAGPRPLVRRAAARVMRALGRDGDSPA